jgi:hypothetical protein
MENGVTLLGHCSDHGSVTTTQPAAKNGLASLAPGARHGRLRGSHRAPCDRSGVAHRQHPERQGRQCEHHGGEAHPPSNKEDSRAHRGGALMAVLDGGDDAPVWTVLQL